jgi:AAA ATPase domain
VPEVVTSLLVGWDTGTPFADYELIHEIVAREGGSLVAIPRPHHDRSEIVVAEFPVAIDATLAALDLSRSAEKLRMVLRTGTRVHGAQAAHLLAQVRDQRILACASTAIMVDPALPPDIELVSRDGSARERIYQLRARAASVRASNLAWARRASTGPLVGRAAASERLDGAWRAALRGHRRTVVITGEAGIGKTALAATLALRAHAAGALVLYGRADHEQDSAHGAICEAFGIDAGRGPRWGFGEELPLKVVVEDWHEHLVLAAERPVLVVLDDLCWSDRSSLDLVDELRHAAPAAPWMLVVTSRAAEAFANETDVERIELRGLAADAISLLAEQILGRSPSAGDEALDWMAVQTAGNPLFVQQILRGVRPLHDLRSDLLAARDHLPELLTEAIRWRLAHHPARTRCLLRHAASIGPTFDAAQLATRASLPSVAVRAALEPVLREELLDSDAGGARYAFRHGVVRRVLEDEVAVPHPRVMPTRATARDARPMAQSPAGGSA